jgi:ankyrin repeat protein
VQSGDLQTLHLLITAGARLTPAAAYDCLDAVPVNKGATPLHLAAIRGDKPVAVLLLTAYVTAAAGALPEVAQSCCTCDDSDDEGQGVQCDWRAGQGSSSGSSCSQERLWDPRTVEDWYGLTPFALADASVQGGSLKQVGAGRKHARIHAFPQCACSAAAARTATLYVFRWQPSHTACAGGCLVHRFVA